MGPETISGRSQGPLYFSPASAVKSAGQFACTVKLHLKRLFLESLAPKLVYKCNYFSICGSELRAEGRGSCSFIRNSPWDRKWEAAARLSEARAGQLRMRSVPAGLKDLLANRG